MSGSNSSDPGSSVLESGSPVGLTVHSMPVPALAEEITRRTSNGRLKMLFVLLVCAAPVIASYLTYFVIRPAGRTNYSELIEPLRPLPVDLALTDLEGRAVAAGTLKGQWLLVVVGGGTCDTACERHLWVQRQLREALGRDKDRVDKVWLIPDAAVPRPQTVQVISTHTDMTVLRVPASALQEWLQPSKGHALEEHMYLVDPLGNWMMRTPPNPDPAMLKRDIEKLLRASAGWDRPGR